MEIELFLVPYDSGYLNTRSGAGPGHFVDNGIEAVLKEEGHRVQVTTVVPDVAFATEVGTTFEVNRHLGRSVRVAVKKGRLPVVISGNCNYCVGAVAGLDVGRLGIVWLDAHGDFNTPETTTSGFLDGMGLAMAAGRCWRSLLGTVPHFEPVAETRIVHVGARDLDAAEREMFAAAQIPLVTAGPADAGGIPVGLDEALDGLRQRADRIYLHVDMDIVDTPLGRSNHFAVTGGLPLPVVKQVVGAVKARFEIAGCTIASYNPAYDEKDCVLSAGFEILRTIVGS